MAHHGSSLTRTISREEEPQRRTAPGESEMDGFVPVSKARLQLCYDSAGFWAGELPRYARFQQSKADVWAIATGVLAAITSLSVFPVVDAGSGNATKLIVAVPAFLAAVAALIPRVKNYAEMAGQARELAPQYGPLVGTFLDLLEGYDAGVEGEDVARRKALQDFQEVKARKDALRYLPDRSKKEQKRAAPNDALDVEEER